jgi:uncharacterized protein (TIGR00251 family)
MKKFVGCEVEVRVTPRASKNRIHLTAAGIKVWVTAPPTDGQANAAVCQLLAKTLGLSKSAVSIAKGDASRTKRIHIAGMDAEDVIRRLEQNS